MSLTIRHIDKPLGHIVEGVDLRTMDDAEFDELDRAYAQYGVLVVRDQNLSPTEQIAFSRRFGELVCYPMEEYRQVSHPEIFVVSNIVENGRPIGMKEAGADWHTDMIMTPNPPRGSILYALEVPTKEDGTPLGDTMFSSSQAAYDALPDKMKTRLADKFAVFGVRPAVNISNEIQAGEAVRKTQRQRQFFKPQAHPLVREHPITGRKTLYFSPNGVLEIRGVSTDESVELIGFLTGHMTHSDFVYRHSWQLGDVVLWDNCNAIHKAVQDYKLPRRRKMYRTTIAGWATH